MAKKRFDAINAEELIAKHNGGTAAGLVRKLVGGEEQHGAAAEERKATEASTSTATDNEPKRAAGRPKSVQRKRTTIFIDEALLSALRREKYENGKDATQVVNEALRRYFGL